MNRKELGDTLRDIAALVSDIANEHGTRALLYMEAGLGWVGGSLFVERKEYVDWVSPRQISEPVRRLWGALPADEKWRGMILFVSDGQFKAEFDYGEGWNEEENEGDRREPIVRRFFGDKPIHYPPLEGAEPWSGQ